MDQHEIIKGTFIIFGATGDLTHRKLMPAFFQLRKNWHLPDDFSIIAIGRKPKTTEEYLEEVRTSLERYTRGFTETAWSVISRQIEYVEMDYNRVEDYAILKHILRHNSKLYREDDNHLFYLAVPPEGFLTISENLDKSGIHGMNRGWQRIIIEKPFGKNLESATELNRSICKIFPEEDIYRIDHYLAKEMIRNISLLRFKNTMFEPLWNREYIHNVQIVIAEQEGVGRRAGYYDQAGAIQDMLQNHLLQVMALVAMEAPASMKDIDLRNKKVELFKQIEPFHLDNLENELLIAQYRGYRDEPGISAESLTETYVAAKFHINNERWKGVPFYLLTGKKLKRKDMVITLEYKRPDSALELEILEDQNFCDIIDHPPNLLQILVQPDEGVKLTFNMKEPGISHNTVAAHMKYTKSSEHFYNTPDSYEQLILDALQGDQTRFTRWDELEITWALIDRVFEDYYNNEKMLKHYDIGSDGPEEQYAFIGEGGCQWWHLNYWNNGDE